MARSIFALALVGLGAVRALPTSRPLEERQIFWGGGTGGESTISPGGSNGTPSPCIGGQSPPTSEQSPCFVSPPITGGLNPPKERRQGVFDIGNLPASEREKAIAALELRLLALKSKPEPTEDELQEIAALEEMLKYTEGITSISAPPGVNTTFTHGDRKRSPSFILPPDYNSNRNHVIDELEKQLEQLQNKEHKTNEDYEDIQAIKAALSYLANITSISAPPGSSTTFHPGKAKRFSLPPDAFSNPKRVIDELERQLEALQNKPFRTDEDRAKIEDIKAALRFLAGVTSISAPPGSSSTFHPGKRSEGAQSSACPGAESVERALEALLHKHGLSNEEAFFLEQLRRYLAGCGISIIQSPEGTTTIIKPSDKIKLVRGSEPESVQNFDADGLENAYAALSQALAATEQPSSEAVDILQQIMGLLQSHGHAIPSTAPGKRQIGGPAVGTRACELAQLVGLQQALLALVQAYGDPARAPREVYQLEQGIVKALQVCGYYMPGWSRPSSSGGDPVPVGPISPDPTYPGGPIIPDPWQPGGTINPDPTEPGSPFKPSDRRDI